MTDNDRIKDRIRKLLAFDGDNASEGELENAMALAQRLMEEHAIAEADIIDAAESAPTERQCDREFSELGANLSRWESTLSQAVKQAVPGVSCYRDARYTRTFGQKRSRRVARIVWYGPVDRVEVARNLFDETRAVIATMAAGTYGGVYRGPGRSYAEGFTAELYNRARRQRRESEHAAQLNEIVLVSGRENDLWLAREHGVRLRHVKSSGGGKYHGDAYGAGRTDGNRHDFTPGKASGKLAGGRRQLD